MLRGAILVGVDFSATSRSALERALLAALAREDVKVHAVHVHTPESPAYARRSDEEARAATLVRLRAALERLVEEVSVDLLVRGEPVAPIQTHVVEGHPASELMRLARRLQAAEIVVGCHGESAARLGPVAGEVVAFAPCPVTICREPEPPSPPLRVLDSIEPAEAPAPG